MGFCDSAADRARARLAVLAMARAAVPAMFRGDIPEDGAAAVALYLTGPLPEGESLTGRITDLMAAAGQITAVLVCRLAEARAGREPSDAQVLAMFDEFELRLLDAENTV